MQNSEDLCEKVGETSINKQVEDILRITGQNEVIQSFVRSDLTNDSEESPKDINKSLIKEKKFISKKINETIITGITSTCDKNRDQKDETIVHLYQPLGKDAQFPLDTNKKNALGNNRHQRLLEEVYTDKDRAAAVNLGSKDIKHSLRLKRRQDRSRVLEISEETHPGTLLALAIHRYKNGDIYVALKFVTKALELNPFDKNALVTRSKCHLLMGNAHLALIDAEQSLKEDKDFINGIYQKAEALYHLAQFEHSLVYFHRGLHMHYQMEHFRQGVLKAQQAILNTIGTTVPGFEKLSLHKKKNDFGCEKESIYGELVPDRDVPIGVISDFRLFQRLQNDRRYLENLLQNSDIIYVNGNSKKDNKILNEVKEGMQFLEKRKTFWRQQQALRAKTSHSFRHTHGHKLQ